MNKKKLVFIIASVFFCFLLIILALFLRSDTENSIQKNKDDSQSFKIWIVGDDRNEFNSFISDFKNLNKNYANTNIEIESFSDYEEYERALSSAIILSKSPDIFVLNNNEDSVFKSQVLAIDPSIINPNDFRKKYKGVFANDLIVEIEKNDGNKVEYLAGIPIGYETLGIFYNRRYVKASDLSSLSGLGNVISNIKKGDSSIIPIGIGNGTTVYDSNDIATQFLMLEGLSRLDKVTGTKLKQGLGAYFYYGSESSPNAYDSKFIELKTTGENNLDLFSKGILTMVVGYPSMLSIIDSKGFSKNFLLATSFPYNLSGDGKTLVNYNYFALNKDSLNKDIAYSLLKFLSSDIGAENYLKKFPYYLPSLLSLESDKLGQKINPRYNIVLGDFYNSELSLSSFDKGIRTIYDRELKEILDDPSNYVSSFEKFRLNLSCKTKKILNLENLSLSCE